MLEISNKLKVTKMPLLRQHIFQLILKAKAPGLTTDQIVEALEGRATKAEIESELATMQVKPTVYYTIQ